MGSSPLMGHWLGSDSWDDPFFPSCYLFIKACLRLPWLKDQRLCLHVCHNSWDSSLFQVLFFFPLHISCLTNTSTFVHLAEKNSLLANCVFVFLFFLEAVRKYEDAWLSTSICNTELVKAKHILKSRWQEHTITNPLQTQHSIWKLITCH